MSTCGHRCCVGHPCGGVCHRFGRRQRPGCALSPVPGAGPGWGAGADLRENAVELLRLVVFEQLCPSARRKLGQLRFWVLSQHIGVELVLDSSLDGLGRQEEGSWCPSGRAEPGPGAGDRSGSPPLTKCCPVLQAR